MVYNQYSTKVLWYNLDLFTYDKRGSINVVQRTILLEFYIVKFPLLIDNFTHLFRYES